MEYIEYISNEMMVLIPCLYIVGMLLKASDIKDKYIPLVLLLLSIAAATFMVGFNINAILQGILCAGTSVFINQLIVQSKKD